VRADPAVAQILIDQAKKAISSGDLDTAVQRLTRASEEEPAAIEATYLLGTVHERRKDPGKALAAYRAFRDAAAEQRRTDTLDKRLAPLVKKAEERIAVLGKGEAELDALQVAFARKVLEAARRAQRDDPDLARHPATSLLAVVPGHAEARNFLDELRGSTSTTAIPRRSGIERWTDLLATKAIEPAARVTYADGMMSLEQTGGSVFWTSTGLRAGPAVLEIEFRCTREARRRLAGGRVVRRSSAPPTGRRVRERLRAGSRVAAVQATEGRQVELGSGRPPLGDRWHRLAVGLEQKVGSSSMGSGSRATPCPVATRSREIGSSTSAAGPTSGCCASGARDEARQGVTLLLVLSCCWRRRSRRRTSARRSATIAGDRALAAKDAATAEARFQAVAADATISRLTRASARRSSPPGGRRRR
jgi:hypothetical protein